MHQPPSNFHGAPSLQTQRVGQQAARVVEVVEPPVPVVTPPLTLTVSPNRRVYLSRALAAHLGLRHGQAIDLIPPRGRWNCGLPWHLDLRPGTPLASLTVFVNGDYKPQFDCCQLLTPARFRYKGQHLPRLTLVLSEPAPVPGFIPLYPVYPQ